MTSEKAIYWLDEIKRAYIKNGDEDYDRQRKEAIDFAIYCITDWRARKLERYIRDTYGVTEEKAREIAETIKDKAFFIGKGEAKAKDYYILGLDLVDMRGEE